MITSQYSSQMTTERLKAYLRVTRQAITMHEGFLSRLTQYAIDLEHAIKSRTGRLTRAYCYRDSLPKVRPSGIK